MSRAILNSFYEDRSAAAAAARTAGQPVVGLIGADLPRELVLAAGALPVSVTAGARRPTPNADIYMDDIVSPEDHDLFEAAMEGRFEGFDLLVLSRPYQHLFYFLKEIFRLGRAPKLPPIWLFDLLPSRREAVHVYNAGCLASLGDQIARATGGSISDTTLSEAIVRMNRVRAGRRRLQALRGGGQLTGGEAMRAFGAGAFMAPDDYVAALDVFLGEVGAAPPASADLGLLVSSTEPLSSPHLHDLLEGTGARVLAEDDLWGARCAEADIALDAPPMTALLDGYWLRGAGRDVYPPDEADRWFEQQLSRPEIEGVVFYVPPSDHRIGWDYPRLAAKAQAAGKGSLLIRDDVATSAGRTAAAARLGSLPTRQRAAVEAQP